MAILSRNLVSAGHEVNWITQIWNEGNDYVGEYFIDPKSISLIKETSYFKGIFTLHKMIKGYNPEIVMSWDIRSSFWLLVLSFFNSWKFVNGSIRHGVVKDTFEHKFRTKVAQFSPFVLANSSAGLKVNRMVPGKRRRVLYNAVDVPSETEDRNGLKEGILNEYFEQWSENDRIIVSVANLMPYKDYPTVMDALNEMDNKAFKYFVIGEGPERKSVERKIEELNLQDKVILLGRRTDVQRWLQIADVFLHSSKGEGCSNAILEAIAAGVPIAASRVGGTPEILPKELGILFEYSNRDSLRSSLEEVLTWDRFSQEFITTGKEHMKRFSNEGITLEFERIIKKWLYG